jgi:hypothetical protein
LKGERITVDLKRGMVWGRRGKALKASLNKDGYLTTCITFEGKRYNFYIHEIIAVAGGMDIIGFTVNHKDEIKLHNWFSNLEPMTQGDNKRYSSKLTWEQVREIRQLYNTGNYYQNEIASRFKLTPKRVSHIINNQSWKEVV